MATVAGALSATVGVGLGVGIAVTVVPDGMPVPVTVIPATMPAVEVTETVGEPVGDEAAVVFVATPEVIDETVAQFASPVVFPLLCGPKHRT